MYTDKYRMTYAALRYILLSCAMAAVFAQDDKTESTSPVVWVLFALLFIIVGAMAVGMFFIAYHFHQRFKKIEIRFSRRGSISSERYSMKNSDSRRSSKRSISSTGRYENNPIRKRRSRSPRSSPPPQQQNNHNSDQVVLPMDTIYRNLQESEQHPQISYTSAMGHYETLAMYAANGSVTGEERKYEESEQEQKQQQQQQQEEVKRVMTMIDGLHKHKSDNPGDDSEDVPIIEASYITPLTDGTVTNRISNGDGNTLEYSDVVNPSPPTPNSKEYAKVNNIQKGKRPNSTEEYTDPMQNGIENMKRLKATTSVKSKSQDSSPAAASKQRRASESAVHRKDFEEWPIKQHGASTVVPAPPPHESDL